ncbi:type IV pilin protein [Colwellia sp. 4_MG-2023]|uniref:type IV pilin protein n=1 Tax=unclassified Colwellia TaxID=196834 RepID=UPI001C0A25C7|nr:MULTISPECIES: type IV pilin protein [unclassified Colwellia]MBU2925366.1 type IV pilin protein [Colwellia sp. C2M11]MDO6487949.1 type IV pilin protein [Colwellia sp. 6_MG-2023]MDO6506052.1 type IV pilin protein [Colwellia sp. 5_MG-2023]MDO6554888.1 type IV pilin protein [Colwellia sp. 4_MG-2023]MDO6653504.1 type IV pilin protein [Colwellia sp. 3_MG-2023]
MSTKTLGFTLIELLITVAIIGILASVAYPSYTDFVLRSNRSEGQRELMRLANLQEQVFVDTRSYASNMKGLGMSTDEYTTESGNYLISVVAGATATTFTLQAVAKKSQVKDTDCTTLKVDYLGAKTPKECWE